MSGPCGPAAHARSAAVDDGARAVREAENRYDLILMDMHMPVMDGAEATKRIRALPPPVCDTRIIALTADASRERRRSYHSAGIDGFLTKPVDWDRLISMVAMMDEPLNAETPPGNGKSATKPTEPENGDLPVLSPDVLSSLSGALGQEETLALLGRFRPSAIHCFEEIGAAAKLDAGPNLSRIVAAAHSLNGAAGNFGFLRIQRIAGRIEDGCSIEALPALIEELSAELGKIDPAIRGYAEEIARDREEMLHRSKN